MQVRKSAAFSSQHQISTEISVLQDQLLLPFEYNHREPHVVRARSDMTRLERGRVQLPYIPRLSYTPNYSFGTSTSQPPVKLCNTWFDETHAPTTRYFPIKTSKQPRYISCSSVQHDGKIDNGSDMPEPLSGGGEHASGVCDLVVEAGKTILFESLWYVTPTTKARPFSWTRDVLSTDNAIPTNLASVTRVLPKRVVIFHIMGLA